MPEVEIRPAVEEDLLKLTSIDHNYTSDFVWQMEIQADENQIAVSFREVRLPRSVRVEYPRRPSGLMDDWLERSGLLVAVVNEETVGYAGLRLGMAPVSAWMTDLAVARRLRRQGIGSALVLAAEEWALQHGCRKLVLEMQTKNYPAVHLAQKLGYEFCGYNDHYYANHDIGLFFAKSVR